MIGSGRNFQGFVEEGGDLMSGTRGVRAVTLDRFRDVARDMDGVQLCDLPPFTTLLVRTMNSLYRVVIARGSEVYVQGGAFFPDLTPAYLEGASIGGSCVRAGWIVIGLLLEIRSEGRRTVTSPVCAISAVRASARSLPV
jgi:hypothetical protein